MAKQFLHSSCLLYTSAEDIKIRIGSAYPRPERVTVDVRGRNLVTGLPKTITVTSEETEEALKDTTSQIVEAVHSVLEKTCLLYTSGMLKVLGKCLTALLIATFAMLAVLMACFKVNINVAFVVTVFVTFVFAAIILNEARKNRIDMVITEKKGNRAIFLLNLSLIHI